MSFRIGCAVWAFKGWLGELYPEGTPHREFLARYGERFTTVEGNTTFYATPDEATVGRWASETPEGFEFCPKLPRTVTHGGLLRPRRDEALRFLERMRGLGTRLGPCFAQLPPRYDPSLLGDLEAFVGAWPHDTAPLALEVRHAGWLVDPMMARLDGVLERYNVARVCLDTRPVYGCEDDPQRHSPNTKPELPVRPRVTADFTMVRFISHPELERNARYLEQWARWVDRQVRAGVTVRFFAHCPLEERSPALAKDFQARLEARGAPVPALPWNELAPPPTQLSLF